MICGGCIQNQYIHERHFNHSNLNHGIWGSHSEKSQLRTKFGLEKFLWRKKTRQKCEIQMESMFLNNLQFERERSASSTHFHSNCGTFVEYQSYFCFFFVVLVLFFRKSTRTLDRIHVYKWSYEYCFENNQTETHTKIYQIWVHCDPLWINISIFIYTHAHTPYWMGLQV